MDPRLERLDPMVVLELEGGSSGQFFSVEGLEGQFRAEPGGNEHLISLMDGQLLGALASWATASSRRAPGPENASLSFATTAGAPMFSHFLGVVEPVVVFGPRTNGFVDELVLRVMDLRPLLPGAMALSKSWRDGMPEETNQWSGLSFHGRRAWLQLVAARAARFKPPTASSHARYVADVRYATDYPGIFLALGEALNGPCGYYGANLDAVEDCLAGGFGPVPPFTLVWCRDKDSLTCDDAWSREWFWREPGRGSAERSAPRGDIVSALMSLFRQHGVTVILASDRR